MKSIISVQQTPTNQITNLDKFTGCIQKQIIQTKLVVLYVIILNTLKHYRTTYVLLIMMQRHTAIVAYNSKIV